MDQTELDRFTADMRGRLAPDARLGAVLKIAFTDGGVIRIDGKTKPAVVDNSDGPADCTLKISSSHFRDLAAGKLSGMKALLLGRLKVQGDMSVAARLGPLIGFKP